MHNGSTLLLEGSPSAFLYGQNLITSNDMHFLCLESLKRVTKQVSLQLLAEVKKQCKRGEIKLSRVDLAVNFSLSSEDEVRDVLTQVKRQLIEQDACVVIYKTSATYSPNDGKDYSISLYAKGAEMRRQRKYNKVDYKKQLLAEAKNILRVEVRLQACELKRLGIDMVSAWTAETPFDVFRQYMRKLSFAEVMQGPVTMEELAQFKPHLRPVVYMHKAGLDWTVPYPAKQRQRHRKELMESYGYNIRASVEHNSAPVSLNQVLSPKRAMKFPPRWLLEKQLCPGEHNPDN
jgi:II/X family phage/plasmid replication protein